MFDPPPDMNTAKFFFFFFFFVLLSLLLLSLLFTSSPFSFSADEEDEDDEDDEYDVNDLECLNFSMLDLALFLRSDRDKDRSEAIARSAWALVDANALVGISSALRVVNPKQS